MAPKRIVLICGAGIATSNMVAAKLERLLKANGVEATLTKGLALETARLAQGADLIVTTSTLPINPNVPVVNGVPFLTGIGEQDALAKILDILKKD